MMKPLVCTLAALLALSCAPASQAAVFERDWKEPGDGLLTYDDVNQREWLDVPLSLLVHFPSPRLDTALAELGRLKRDRSKIPCRDLCPISRNFDLLRLRTYWGNTFDTFGIDLT